MLPTFIRGPTSGLVILAEQRGIGSNAPGYMSGVGDHLGAHLLSSRRLVKLGRSQPWHGRRPGIRVGYKASNTWSSMPVRGLRRPDTMTLRA